MPSGFPKNGINKGRFKKGHKSYLTKESKIKIGQNNAKYWLGKKRSLETRNKIAAKLCGSQSNLWKGGISAEPYSLDWTRTLRRCVRERDKYTCQMCGKLQSDRAFDVHHIDHNKKNNNPVNLITLCKRCHSRVGQHRKYWEKILKNYIANYIL